MSLPNPLQTLLLPMAAELTGTAPMAMKTPAIRQTAEDVKKTIFTLNIIKFNKKQEEKNGIYRI
jgi:hypothetical protein